MTPFFGRRSRGLRRARAELVAADATAASDRELLAAVSLKLHRRDTMLWPGRPEHYLSVGLSALACIDQALAPGTSPASVLDFACGYGRVLRFLRVRFPDSRLVASEIDPAAVRFCARTFGISTYPSTRSLLDMRLPERFDLIWCGSLITHLNRVGAERLLGFFARHLTETGTCVLSAHGDVSVRAFRNDEGAYGFGSEATRTLLDGFDSTGYGYVDYAGQDGYGASLVRRKTLVDMAGEAGLRETSFQPAGWDDHHDVYGFERV